MYEYKIEACRGKKRRWRRTADNKQLEENLKHLTGVSLHLCNGSEADKAAPLRPLGQKAPSYSHNSESVSGRNVSHRSDRKHGWMLYKIPTRVFAYGWTTPILHFCHTVVNRSA